MIKKKGFTLIELLVVIAIIGILAAIVLVSLSGARDKANDARITADLGQVRSAAEIWMDDNEVYTGMDAAGEDVATLLTDVDDKNGDGVIVKGIADDFYCVYSQLKSDASKYLCVDSNLVSDKFDAVPATCTAACAALATCKCE